MRRERAMGPRCIHSRESSVRKPSILHATVASLVLGLAFNAQAADVTGAGASFIYPVMTKWSADYSKATGKQVFSETKKVPTSRKGTTTQVQIPITSPVSGSVTVKAEVKPVPCEVNKTNNTQSFPVIFG